MKFTESDLAALTDRQLAHLQRALVLEADRRRLKLEDEFIVSVEASGQRLDPLVYIEHQKALRELVNLPEHLQVVADNTHKTSWEIREEEQQLELMEFKRELRQRQAVKISDPVGEEQ